MAVSHANRMITDIFQPDKPGCVWHLITYNDSDGTILNRSSTPQGLGLDTVWSRGQGWATYGFIMAYRYTQDPAYLATAAAAADCFIKLVSACCSSDWAPWWDFYAGPPLAPDGPKAKKDTSAAMIAAGGIIELGERWGGVGRTRARAGVAAATRARLAPPTSACGPGRLTHPHPPPL